MTDADRFRDRMLAAARADKIPRGSSFDRIARGIAERIATDEPEPVWTIEDQRPHARWVAYAVGALVAAALALALLLGPGVATEDADAGHANAAVYGEAPAIEPAASVSRARSGADSPRPSVSAPTEASPLAPEPEPPSPSRRTPRSRSGSGGPAAEQPAPSAFNVAGEAVALRRVHAALERGELATARAALRAYRSEFRIGALRPEADGLAAIVACRASDADASSRAARFAAEHPASPMIARVRTACESSSREQTDASASRHP